MSQQAALEPTRDDPRTRHAQWKRVDPRTALGRPLDRLTHLAPFFLSAVVFGESWWAVAMNVTGAALVIVVGAAAWLTTRYRVTDEHLEVHRGLINRQHLKVPRERIRAVDFTSSYIYRVLRIVRVRIGTGEHDGVTLTALSRNEAAQLRQELMRHVVRNASSRPRNDTERLASFTPSWLRYAPLSLSGFAAVTAVGGLLFSFINHLDDKELTSAATTTEDWLSTHPLWLPAALIVLAVAMIFAVGSLGMYILNYWNFQLHRTDDQLQTQRGLLTTFSRSIAGHRIRGFELIEELFIRAARGGVLTALTTGLGAAGDRVILLPPSPVSGVKQVSAQVLRASDTPLFVPLSRHPIAALRRRLVRSLGPVLVVAAVVTCIWGAGPWLWTWALVAPAALLGWDRYRSLGNALTPHHLVSRSGSIYRHTVALQRDGIIGWHVRQSWSQRRSGLMTVTAATAAGHGGYSVVDVDATHGVQLAAHAAAGMIDDMISHGSETSHDLGHTRDEAGPA